MPKTLGTALDIPLDLAAIDPALYVDQLYRHMAPDAVLEHLVFLETGRAPRGQVTTPEGDETVFSQLRNVDARDLSLDETVYLLVLSEALAAGYKRFDLAAPEWLGRNILLLERRVAEGRRDNLDQALQVERDKVEEFKSAEQKVAEAEAEIARLEELRQDAE